MICTTCKGFGGSPALLLGPGSCFGCRGTGQYPPPADEAEQATLRADAERRFNATYSADGRKNTKPGWHY